MADPHMIRRGSGEPVLLIHGLHHSKAAWTPMVDALAERFDVIVVDLPGHSGADPLDVEPTTDALADHLESVLDREGIDRAHLVGNSMGGLLALRLAERGRARSVTAFSPGGMIRPGWEQALTTFLVREVFLTLTPRIVDVPFFSRSTLGRALALSPVIGRPDLVSPDYAHEAMQGPATTRDAHRTIDGLEQWVGDVKPIDVPVTIAWGSRDRLLWPRQGLRWKAAVPHARLITLPTLGHLPMGEDPALCTNLVIRTAAMAAGDGAPVTDHA